MRARDLFYGLWIPDLFMERVYNDEKWCLMCPHESPGLADVWGDEFVELYTRYTLAILLSINYLFYNFHIFHTLTFA